VATAERTEDHLPSQVLLRFASEHVTGSQVFLHALGATATFGRDFGSTHSAGLVLDGQPIRVVLPPATERSGCGALTRPSETEFVLLLDRGGCLFSDKLQHAAQAGAAGVILIEKHDPLAPGNHGPLPEGALIRPSAEDCSPGELDALKDTGMVFTTEQVGEIVKRTIELEGRNVVVELKTAETDMRDTAGSERKREEGAKSREGRMALGQWEIWNLKIVEAI